VERKELEKKIKKVIEEVEKEIGERGKDRKGWWENVGIKRRN